MRILVVDGRLSTCQDEDEDYERSGSAQTVNIDVLTHAAHAWQCVPFLTLCERAVLGQRTDEDKAMPKPQVTRSRWLG